MSQPVGAGGVALAQGGAKTEEGMSAGRMRGELPEQIGPGPLVLVVGPSGAGKDTLMRLARQNLEHERPAGERQVHFARRLVTRSPDKTSSQAGEDHDILTLEAFARRQAAGEFPLAWQAHGLSYALGPEVRAQLLEGACVVANGSRATLGEARARFAHLAVVLVSAPQAVLAARLAARGRETALEIQERLSRAPAMPVKPDLIIQNMGAPEDAATRLAAFIAAQAHGRPPHWR
ncbi:phosphonate metabolism protein/1,5-bisphosphokinase (PRPP-forming) PhnN [Xanthobacter sp. TB0139]|uniref:phosphonate metabolism protein/1,5-bisphosphokinase (PRPP-forming) PhnN n=1 Tax=Xanthobacter sp. TB0139 TaxID=3459178 RepID=UPI00403A147C